MATDEAARDVVEVTNWQACYNSGDNEIVLSCTVSILDASASITGAGLILVDRTGKTLSSSYANFDGSKSVDLSLDVPPNGIGVGDFVMGVATGEAAGQHYFEEQKLQVSKC